MTKTSTLRRSAFSAAAGIALFLPTFGASVSMAAGSAPPSPTSAPSADPAAVVPEVGTRVTSFDNGGGLSVTARLGKANVINIALSNITFTVRDTGDVVTPGVGCTAVDPHTVRCTAFAQPVRVSTLDLDDTVNAPLPLAVTVNAGVGNDVVTTGTGADSLQGGPGNDRLVGGAGGDKIDGGLDNDSMFGEAGRDTLEGGGRINGADVLSGGADLDVADYDGRELPVRISLDDVANDGEVGEGDNVRSDIEDVLGGEGADTITGSSLGNRLVGNEGSDTLNGLAGRDNLFGGDGPDVLNGGVDDDNMDGGLGADRFFGGLGVDEVRYNLRTESITVRIDDQANDGATSERDDVRTDVEDVQGGSARDALFGSDAANRLDGSGGDDFLDGGLGSDDLIGGSGRDEVSYFFRTQTVIANIDNLDNDGVGPEKDNITSSVEIVTGGRDNDLIGGSNNDDTLVGGPGDDILLGFDGNDNLRGEEGIDGLNCGNGAFDRADGGSGNDRSLNCETNVNVETIG